MSLITNSKIGFTRYAGFSILFNNPGENNYTPMWKGSKLQQIYCSENDTLNLHLYIALKNALQKTGLETNFKKYLFFDLPFYSYHVTVWDGLNEGNIENIAKKYRPELNEFLQKLSCSLEQDNIFIKSAESSNLVNKNQEITFRFKKLTIWGNSVLVALLEPVDDASVQLLENIKSDRIELYTQYEKEFGREPSKTDSHYNPHVSLGYFGNEGAGEAALAQLDQWTKVFLDLTGDTTIHFGSASLYGFTDMQTFFRKI